MLEEGPQEKVAEAEKELEAVAQTLGPRVRNVSVRAEAGNATVTITRLAEDEQAAAIVMAAHGRSGLARLVLGSVAAGVVQRSCVPTVVVGPAGDTTRRPGNKQRLP